MIVKHANPCGVAVGATAEEAYDRALASDPTSAYGGVVVLNRDVEAPLAEKLAAQFVEVLFAPGFTDDALNALRRKKNVRILLDGERRAGVPGERNYKRVIGGMLVGHRRDLHPRRQATIAAWANLKFLVAQRTFPPDRLLRVPTATTPKLWLTQAK